MNRNILVNSSLLFVIAATAETISHEGGHFTMAFLFHAGDLSLHHNFVNYGDGNLTIQQRILIASAGPLVSLFIGILFHLIIIRYRSPDLLRLFFLYMSAFGYIGFLGYLMIAPFFKYGDTGFVCSALQFPIYLTAALAVFGGFLLYLVMKSICREFIPFLSKEDYENDKERKQEFNFLIQFPLYIGIVITTLLNLPTPTPLSLIAPLCSPFSILWGFGPLMRKKYDYPSEINDPATIDKLSFIWFILFIGIIIINRILANGIKI